MVGKGGWLWVAKGGALIYRVGKGGELRVGKGESYSG